VTLSRRRLRLWLDPILPLKGEELQDYDACRAPILIAGNAIDLEIAIFNGSSLTELDDIDSITATFKASQNSEESALASITVEADDFNADFSRADFKSGEDGAWHARFQFTDAQMTWDMGGGKTLDAWLVITATLTDGSEVTLGMGLVRMDQDNSSLDGGVLPAAVFTRTNDYLAVLCPDGETRYIPLLNEEP